MPPAEFEPTIPVFKRAKTFHALDRVASVTGETLITTTVKTSNLMFMLHYSLYSLLLCSLRIELSKRRS
jgi:hypothetical protein